MFCNGRIWIDLNDDFMLNFRTYCKAHEVCMKHYYCYYHSSLSLDAGYNMTNHRTIKQWWIFSRPTDTKVTAMRPERSSSNRRHRLACSGIYRPKSTKKPSTLRTKHLRNSSTIWIWEFICTKVMEKVYKRFPVTIQKIFKVITIN